MVEKLLKRIKELEERFDSMECHYKEIIRKKDEEISELKSQLNKDSHNSSLSPSSDKFQRKIKNSRVPTNKKSGGQKKHLGSNLPFSKNPDKIINLTPKSCKHCHSSLGGIKSVKYSAKQMIDFPPIKPTTTEYRNHSIECPCCGNMNQEEFPVGINTHVQYGQNIKSFLVYLSVGQLIPYKRISLLLRDLVGLSISEGTIYNTLKECYNNLESFESSIIQSLKSSPILHLDETGAYCKKKRGWIHTNSTKFLTLLKYNIHRGKKAIDEIGILTNYKGAAVHDCYVSYSSYECRHVLCNAHLLRELIFQYEEKNQEWAKQMKKLLLTIKESREKESKPQFSKYKIQMYLKEYEKILKNGFSNNEINKQKISPSRGRVKQSDTVNLLLRLQNFNEQILAFMFDFKMPFDNNQAERDFRMVKVQQKISGTFRSELGAQMFCRIRSFISTVDKNSKNIFEQIQYSFQKNKSYDHIWAE